jgi:hypothetical protein
MQAAVAELRVLQSNVSNSWSYPALWTQIGNICSFYVNNVMPAIFDWPGEPLKNERLRSHFVLRPGEAILVRAGPNASLASYSYRPQFNLAWSEIPVSDYKTIR